MAPRPGRRPRAAKAGARSQGDAATLKKALAEELSLLAREANTDYLARQGNETINVREGLLARLEADFESAHGKAPAPEVPLIVILPARLRSAGLP